MNPTLLRATAVGAALLLFTLGQLSAAVSTSPTVPPAPVIEKPLNPAANYVQGDQPTAQHNWVPGHWRWHEGAYVWEAGRWEVPPAPNLVWHAPEWQQQGNGYVLREGYWDEAPPPAAV